MVCLISDERAGSPAAQKQKGDGAQV